MRIKYICLASTEQSFQEAKNSLNFPMVSKIIIPGKDIEIFNTDIHYIKLLKYQDRYRIHDMSQQINRNLNLEDLGLSWTHLSLYEQLSSDDGCDAYMILSENIKQIGEFIEPDFGFHLVQYAKNVTHYPLQHTNRISEDYSYIARKHLNNASSYLISKKGAILMLRYFQSQICNLEDLLAEPFVYHYIDIVAPYLPVFED